MKQHELHDEALALARVTADVDWMGTTEAAAYLGVNLRTLYRFIDGGDLPAYKFGRVIRLRREEIDAFITNARIQPGSLEHLYPEPMRQAGR